MMLLAARLEYEAIQTPAKMQAAYDRGHKAEEIVVEKLRQEYGWSVVSPQLEVVLQVSGKISVVGHVDGIRWDGRWQEGASGDQPVIEIKSQNRTEWDRFDNEGWNGGLFPRYKWQLSSYMHAESRPAVLIRALWEDGDVQELAFHDIFEPWYSVAEIRARVLRIEAVAQTGVLAAECQVQFPCPYFYLHEELDRELVDDTTIETLAATYEELRREAANVKGQQDATRRALREAVGDDLKVQTADGTKVTFYMAANPPTLDKARLNARLERDGDALDNYLNKTKSERIRVTLPDNSTKDGDDGKASAGDS